ncbi:hypothetical protein [Azospirillum soli]|uniref:hypothetical protein n=1 Tax=Azospirillum soli TaxID=1304799 RepID=UPI001AE66069|nr:hypothetical protein [Azospirillum soli]MBP2313459.1 hypothetical protein [Azospirillum soli]
MSLTSRDVASSVFGAYRLARFDPTGLDYMDRTPEGAWKSFYAAIIILPAYALLLAIRLWDQAQDTPLFQLVTVEAIAYVVSWTAFPVIMHGVTRMLDRSSRYVDFLCAYNWSSVVQMAVYLPVVVLAATGLLPAPLSEGLVFGVMLAMLTYQWFVLRTALDVPGLTAAILVLLDLFLSALITDFADGLL